MIRPLIAAAAVLSLSAIGNRIDTCAAAGESISGSGSESSQSVCDYGIFCAFQGNLSRAESVFVQVLSQSPRDARALTNIGNLKILNGDTRLALSFYDNAAIADTNDAGIVLNQATALYLLGDTTGADLTYARGIELAGGFREAANLLGLYVEPEQSDARAADKSRLRRAELLRRLDLAEKLIPPDPAGAPADSSRAHRKRLRTQRPTRYRIGAARAGEEATATVLYWGR